MRIAIDVREAQSQNPTGKGLFVRHLLHELKNKDVELIELDGTGGLLWHVKTAHKLKTKIKPDLFLSTTSYITPWLVGRSVPVAIVIHDLIAFDNEPHNKKAKAIERATLPKVLKTARHIFTVSEATKQDLLERFSKTDQTKITTIYEGPTMRWRSDEVKSLPAGQAGLRGCVLCVGTLCPRKNQLRLIQAFNTLAENLRKDHPLILVGGRGWDDDAIVKLAEASEHVEWRGYVDEHEMTELMRSATVFAYPSLKEGFGLPVLDAMTLGIPVLTSNRSSMPEIASEAAVLVDPENVEEMTRALEKLLSDSDLRKNLSEHGQEQAQKFNWKKTVDLLLNAIKN